MALGDILARLSVELSLNSAAFEKGASRAGAQANDLGNRMEKLGNRVGTAIRGFAAAGAALGGAFIIDQVKQMATAGLEHASALGEQAQQLGVTTSELQRYRYIATQVGIDQDVMDKGLARLSVTLGDLAQGAKAPTAALTRLGFTQQQIADVSKMTAGEAIPVLSDAFAKLKSPTEQAALAADLFGAKMGGKFLTLLAGGSAEINKLADAYKRLGIELSPEEIAKADELADKMAALQEVIKARQAKVAVGSYDAILQGTEAWEGFKVKMLEVAGNTASAWSTIEKYTTEFSDAIKRIDAQLGIPSPKAMTDSIVKNFSESWKRITDFFTGLYNFTVAAPGWIANMVSQIGSNLGGRLKSIMDAAVGHFGKVKAAAFDMWDKVTRRSYVPDMVDDIAREMARLDAVMVNPAKNATDRTKQVFEKLGSDVDGIMRRLFPDAATQAGFLGDRAALNAGITAGGVNGYTVPQLQEALRALQSEEFRDAFKDFQVAANDTADTAQIASVRIAESFKDAANKTLSAFQSMTNAIKGGGFLDILGSVIGFGMQLGSIGVFGKNIATRINTPIPAHANGTMSARPGLALVGERGPELVAMRGGERVFNNRDSRGMMGGGTTNNYFSGNLMTPEFWQQINAGDARAAMNGSSGAQVAMAVKQSRRFP